MTRVVVTGCAGFIGSHLSEMLIEKEYDVLGIDNFMSKSYASEIKRSNIKALQNSGNFEFREIDLLGKLDSGIFQNGDVVINEAAMPGLPLSWIDPKLYFEANTFLPINLLNAISGVSLSKFIQISTSSVYGKFAVGDEKLALNPNSPYGVSKLSAEHMIRNYCTNNEIPFNILRYFSVFGPRQRPDMAYSQIIRKMARGEPIEIFGDGKQSRTNTFVTDIVMGTILAMETAPNGEVYNLAGSTSVTLSETIRFIAEEMKVSKPQIIQLPERIGDQRETKGVFEKASKHFGYRPEVDFWEGLKLQIEYQNANFKVALDLHPLKT
jgi:nucleoside-diphosphate-sugar epimerase